MTTATTTAQFPAHRKEMENLVEQHKRIKDEPLLLAVYYEPDRDNGDLFLFEVADGFGSNQIDPDQELFEVTYGATDEFPMETDQKLHLVLANPAEASVAFEEGWPLASEIREAARRKKAAPLYQTEEGASIWEKICE